MRPSYDELIAFALALPSAERALLAVRLTDSLREDEADSLEAVERSWLEEAKRRLAEMETGAVEGIDIDDALARVRESLKR